ncbi:MAG: histidine ammonia-lyase [Bacteroidota bacterium]
MSPVPLRIEKLESDLDASLAAIRRHLGAPECRIRASREALEHAMSTGAALYGVNTGFGALKGVRIGDEKLETLQHNLLRSHAVGMGEPIEPAISRRMLRLKVHALGLGYSGVSVELVDRLLAMLDHDLVPVVPCQGSLGASGDLAPLAHLALPLIGEGEVWEGDERIPAAEALRDRGLEPLVLGAKEGIALINGTQFMAAHLAEVVARSARLATSADVVAAMTLEALRGSARPFEAAVQAVRPHPGAIASASNVCALLAGSEIGPSHADCGKVQDPYSVRCVPPVHGASRDAMAYVASVLEVEVNSVTDNPLVLEGGDVVSAGAFHGQPLALAADMASIAVAEWASVSERRTYLLLDGLDDLPPFLLRESGLNSGFMMPQYLAAALVSENKTLAHPASVDSIPSSRNQEDHVSMGAWGARKALRIVENAERVLGVEALCAAQALELRRPLRAGRGVEAALDAIRERIPFREADRPFEADLRAAADLVRSGALAEAPRRTGADLV